MDFASVVLLLALVAIPVLAIVLGVRLAGLRQRHE